MLTFGQLKTDCRSRLFPSCEADNLVADHDKSFIDALIDLQTWVPCLQQDNTDIFPQCSTTYNCGLTVLPVPRGIIKKVSVIDKIDPVNHLENPDVDDDWCSEVVYTEVDSCHVRRYLDMSRRGGCCLPIGLFFGLGFCHHRPYPTPTNAGLPSGLAPLPLGYSYPQSSTDRTWGRAGGGVWAKDRTNILVAPWIQSTESVVIKWDGLKRSWGDADLVDDDPLFVQAVELYVRWQHAWKWDKDQQAAQDAAAAYAAARAQLIHQCREETRVRGCEPSFARGSVVSSGMSSLYYNDQDQTYTATCPDGVTSVTKTVKAGTVSSSKSVADANSLAHDQAVTQANASLVCNPVPVQATNDTAGDYTASCQGDPDSPPPTTNSPRVIIPKGTIYGTGPDQASAVADANAKAQQAAEDQAKAQLVCTFHNKAVTLTFTCSDGTQPGNVSYTVAASDPTCDSVYNPAMGATGSQSWANQLAVNKCETLLSLKVAGLGVHCGGQPVSNVGNSELFVPVLYVCPLSGAGIQRTVTVMVHVPANTFNQIGTQVTVNQYAQDQATTYGKMIAQGKCAQGLSGRFAVDYPTV